MGFPLTPGQISPLVPTPNSLARDETNRTAEIEQATRQYLGLKPGTPERQLAGMRLQALGVSYPEEVTPPPVPGRPAAPPPPAATPPPRPPAPPIEEERAPIRAEMVNGKLVFTNAASLGGQDVGYDAGVDRWQDRALVDQELLANSRGEAAQRAVGYGPGNESGGGYDGPALRRPEDSRFRDFTIQRTPERAPGPVRADQTGFRGSYIPSAPVPDVAGLDQTGFEQKMAEMTRSASPGAQDEFKQRYLEQEGIRQEIAKRALTEGQAAQAQGVGAQGQAAAGVDVARTAILNDPVANAVRQGTATAEQMKAFQSTLMQEAQAQVDAELAANATRGAAMAEAMVRAGVAKTPTEAAVLVRQRLAQARFNQIIDQDPEMKKALARAGMYMGAGALGIGGGPST